LGWLSLWRVRPGAGTCRGRILAKDVDVASHTRLVPARVFHDVFAEPRLEAGLASDDIPKLLLRQLKQRGVARGRNARRAADEALPQRRVRPYLLDDQPVEERGRNEGDERLVRLQRLDNLVPVRECTGGDGRGDIAHTVRMNKVGNVGWSTICCMTAPRTSDRYTSVIEKQIVIALVRKNILVKFPRFRLHHDITDRRWSA
jgi:hypothetical protein